MSHGKGITRIGTWGDPPRIITMADSGPILFLTIASVIKLRRRAAIQLIGLPEI